MLKLVVFIIRRLDCVKLKRNHAALTICSEEKPVAFYSHFKKAADA